MAETGFQFNNPIQNKVMKNNRIKNYCGLAVATLLVGGASLTFAQTADLPISTFDAGTQGAQPDGCGFWYGSGSAGWDGTVGNPVGSLYIQTTFGPSSDTPLTEYICLPGDNLWYPGKGTFTLSLYKSIEFDIRWDNTSTVTLGQFNDLSTWPQTNTPSWAPPGYLSGSTPGLEVDACYKGDGSTTFIAYTNIPSAATSGWVHVAIPIVSSTANIDPSIGIIFKKWINNNWAIQSAQTANFWIDNVMLQGTAGPPPPPTVSLAPAQPGLNLFAGTSGGNDRENIRTVSTNLSWVGHGSTPVSYTFTITNYPGPSAPYFMINSFLIPVPYDRTAGTNGSVGGEASPDWNEATCIFMDFENYNDGSGDWRFRYKTNSPSSNGTSNSYYADMQVELHDTAAAGVLGTWTLTFVNNTNVTMTHNDSGASTNFVFSPDKVSWWADNSGAPLPMYYYIGCRGQGSGAGLAAVLSRATIQGTVDTLNDNFLADTALDTNKWQVVAAYAPSIQLVPSIPKPVYWVNWTLPAAGYQLESSSALTGPWKTSVEPTLAFAGIIKTLVTASDLPSANAGYFRAAKLVATQLQVLLPGETSAPGTVSGKTGTPSAQTVGNPFNLTINACDANWNIVQSVNDSVAITSSDTSAWLPPNTPLVNGTVTITGNFYFGASGTWTVTATDVPNPGTISAGTSTPITIP